MPNMRELVAELEARRAKVREMGGADKVAQQHARGKMTARERLAALFDDGVFFEVGAHGTQMGLAAGPDGNDKPPADAVVTAFGKVDGRMVMRGGLRLHRQGRQHRIHRRGEGHAPAVDGAARPLAHRVAHRLGRRAHRSRARATRTCSRCSPAPGTSSASRSS